MFTDDRQALWWSLVAGSFFWYWREADSPCDGPWWLGASSGTGERQAVSVMVPGGWYCAGGLWGALALLVLCWGAMGSPGFAGTVLGLWGALASLVLCWGAVGSPSFAGTVLGLWGALASLVLCWGAVGSPGFAGTVLGGCGEPWLRWYCAGGLWGALASLVLCWGGCGEPWLRWELRYKFLKFSECSNRSKYCFTS